ATTSDQRKLNGCQDSGNNNNDFSVLTPNPRNTSTATNICSCSSSYSSRLTLGDSWKNSLAMVSVDRLLYNRGWSRAGCSHTSSNNTHNRTRPTGVKSLRHSTGDVSLPRQSAASSLPPFSLHLALQRLPCSSKTASAPS